MKTQITKLNAIAILEGTIRQGRLSQKLNTIMDTTAAEWLVHFSDICVALFNVDRFQQNELEPYHQAYYKAIDSESKDYGKLADKLCSKCLALSLEEEPQKNTNPGVISILKGNNYTIKGEFGLNT